MAEMSTEAFEDFYFDVCTLDYAKMGRAMEPLIALMERTERCGSRGRRIRICIFRSRGFRRSRAKGTGTFRMARCSRRRCKRSVNGVIHSIARRSIVGSTHKDVRLVFKNGKIVEATSSETQKLNEVFDTDAGSRYVGEFAIGFNPYVHEADEGYFVR